MSDSTVRVPVGKVSWPWGDISSDYISIEQRIGSHVTCSFSFFQGFDAASKASKVIDEKAAALMGEIQGRVFSDRSAPDCKIAVTDGAGGAIEIAGYLVGPTFSLSTSNFQPGAIMAGESSQLNRLRLDIYNANTQRERNAGTPLSEGYEAGLLRTRSMNLPERLGELTRLMIRYWESNRSETEALAASAAIKNNIHASNQDPLELWFEYLKNSGELCGDWVSIIARDEGSNLAFNTELLSVLRGRSITFQNVIDTLCSEYGLLDVPDREGKPGRLKRLSDLIYGEGEDLTLSPNAIFLSITTGFDAPPLQQVALRGLPISAHEVVRGAHGLLPDGTMLVGGYPETALSTSGVIDMPPAPFYLQQILQMLPGQATPGTGTLDPTASRSKFTKLDAILSRYKEQVADKLATSVAKDMFALGALQPYSASVSVPLDLKLSAGSRYRVKNSGGADLFTGLLSGVSHSIHKTAKSATTRLDFSFVEYSGFVLP